MLFADDAIVAAHSPSQLNFSWIFVPNHAQISDSLLASKKTKFITPQCQTSLSNNYKLEVVEKFTYLGSTISSMLSLDTQHGTRVLKNPTQYQGQGVSI